MTGGPAPRGERPATVGMLGRRLIGFSHVAARCPRIPQRWPEPRGAAGNRKALWPCPLRPVHLPKAPSPLATFSSLSRPQWNEFRRGGVANRTMNKPATSPWELCRATGRPYLPAAGGPGRRLCLPTHLPLGSWTCAWVRLCGKWGHLCKLAPVLSDGLGRGRLYSFLGAETGTELSSGPNCPPRRRDRGRPSLWRLVLSPQPSEPRLCSYANVGG